MNLLQLNNSQYSLLVHSRHKNYTVTSNGLNCVKTMEARTHSDAFSQRQRKPINVMKTEYMTDFDNGTNPKLVIYWLYFEHSTFLQLSTTTEK